MYRVVTALEDSGVYDWEDAADPPCVSLLGRTLQIVVTANGAGIHFPYSDLLDSQTIVDDIATAARVITGETGWKLHDPQLAREVDPDSKVDLADVRSYFESGPASLALTRGFRRSAWSSPSPPRTRLGRFAAHCCSIRAPRRFCEEASTACGQTAHASVKAARLRLRAAATAGDTWPCDRRDDGEPVSSLGLGARIEQTVGDPAHSVDGV